MKQRACLVRKENGIYTGCQRWSLIRLETTRSRNINLAFIEIKNLEKDFIEHVSIDVTKCKK